MSLPIENSVPVSTFASSLFLFELGFDAIRMRAGSVANLDVGADATLDSTDPSVTIDRVSFGLAHGFAAVGDHLALDPAAFDVSATNGLLAGSKITVLGTEIGQVLSDGSGVVVAFNTSATLDLVELFLRAVAYVSASADATFIGVSDVEISIKASDGTEAVAKVSVTIAPENAILLTDSTDIIIGTENAEVFAATEDWFGRDKLDGGSGEDILRLLDDGDPVENTFLFHRLDLFAGIESIEGSDKSDTVWLDESQLAGVRSIDGGDGADELSLRGIDLNLVGKEIQGFEHIVLQTNYATVATDSLAVAELVDGRNSFNDALNLSNVAITDTQRRALHQQGIDTITAVDAVTGTSITTTHTAPRVTGLEGDHVVSTGKVPVFLDAGRNAAIVADDYLKLLQVSVDKTSRAGTSFGLDVSGSITLSHGMTKDSIVTVGSPAKGFTAIGQLSTVADGSLIVSLNSSATAERVQELVRALTFAATENPFQERVVSLLLEDVGGRISAFKLTVEPQLLISLDGSAAAEGAPSGKLVGNLKVVNGRSESTFTYKLLDDAGGRFVLQGGSVVVAAGLKLDYEQATSHIVKIRASDQTGRFVDQEITAKVSDVASENLKGSAAHDVLVGGANKDRFDGSSGNDKLSGGGGEDTLTGGKGKDIFVFVAKLNKKTNVDKIADFNHRDDTIHLAKSVFSKNTKMGVLSSSAFWAGDKAHDASDRIVYNKKTGALYYDQDGTGSTAAVQFATLEKKPGLAANDSFVI